MQKEGDGTVVIIPVGILVDPLVQFWERRHGDHREEMSQQNRHDGPPEGEAPGSGELLVSSGSCQHGEKAG